MSELDLPIREQSDDWGPTGSPGIFDGIPFQSFSRNDRVGKAADFMSNRAHRERNQRTAKSADSTFVYKHEGGKDFTLVDTAKPQMQRRRIHRRQQRRVEKKPPPQQQAMTKNKNLVRDRQRQERQLRAKWNAAAKRRGERYQRRNLGPSIDVKPHWEVVRELEFSKLSKPMLEVDRPKDVHLAGEVHLYNPEFDAIRPRTAKRLNIPRGTTRYVSVTTSADPVMKTLMAKGAANVFITDDILATIMVASRSFYSWDIVVRKEGDRIVFDKRANSRLDYLTVNENGPNPHFSQDPRHPNHQLNLNREATFVHQHFQEQTWTNKTVSMGNPDPTGAPRHKIGYRYRLWDLEDDVKMLVRCSHDALVQTKSSKYFASICSVNEWYPDLKQDTGWRHRLEAQKGAVWAAALKDNSCKISRWVVQAMLAGNRELKFGFVSRASPSAATKHEILTVQTQSTAKLAKHMAISMHNGWGIIRSLVDLIAAQEDGEYLLFKDPQKEVLKIIAVPEKDEEEAAEEERAEEEEEEAGGMLDDEEFI